MKIFRWLMKILQSDTKWASINPFFQRERENLSEMLESAHMNQFETFPQKNFLQRNFSNAFHNGFRLGIASGGNLWHENPRIKILQAREITDKFFLDSVTQMRLNIYLLHLKRVWGFFRRELKDLEERDVDVGRIGWRNIGKVRSVWWVF